MVSGLVLYSAAAWVGRDMLGKEAPFYLAGLGAALMIAAMVRHPRLARPFSTPVLVRLGQLSYGVYLLHFPLLLAVTWAVERAGASGQMILPCLVVVTLALSWVLFHTVEKPFIAWGRRLSGSIGDSSVKAAL
jgi:peptidoglycan/LPS O-acetylase OafA/YrhL